MAKIMQMSLMQIQRLLQKLDAKPYESKEKSLNLVVYKKYPFSSKRLYSATSYAQRKLNIVKEVRASNKIKLAARYSTKFNFYEVEHTE
jgi:hypothetical protein